MTTKKIFWGITILIILIFFYGIYGLFENEFIQSDVASVYAWWFLIPTIPLAIYYSIKLSFGYDKKTPFWRNLLTCFAMSIFISLIFVKSFQGYLYKYNCSIGEQKPFLLKGIITNVSKPRRSGRPFSIFTMEVFLDSNQKRIKLQTSSKKYKAGERLDAEVKIGSLGYIYLP